MADTNWIKLNRSILNHWVWTEQPFSKGQAWIDMLLQANYMDKKIMFDGQIITVKRGSFVTSIAKLADRWDWDKRKVKRYLMALESDGMLSFTSTTRCTTITIENYDIFQGNGTTDGTTDSPTDVPLDALVMSDSCTQHKKVKKEKKDKESKEIKNKVFVPDELLNEAVLSYVEYRKGIKKPMTDRAVDLLIKKLDGMAADTGTKIAILNQSILNGWQGIFPLKDDKPAQKEQGGRLDWIDNI